MTDAQGAPNDNSASPAQDPAMNPATATAQSDPPDQVLAALDRAVSEVTGAQPGTVAQEIVRGLDGCLKALLAAEPHPSPNAEDTCANPDPAIAQNCVDQALALAQAEIIYQGSQSGAAGVFQTALLAWSSAKLTYAHAAAGADVTLQGAVSAAIHTYKQKINRDSSSRNMNLYYTMKGAVATALGTYEGTMATAGSTLASAAGTLLAAYVTYITAVQAAQTTRQGADATARQTFWSSVESTRDATS